MTSKISFSKMVRDELGKLNWLTVMQLLIFGLLIPFKVLMILAARATEIKKYNMDLKMTEVFYDCVGFDCMENTLLVVAAGIFCALFVFSYLHNSAKLDFLPIRRETLFAVKFLAAFLTFGIAYGVSQLLTLVIGIGYGVVNRTILLEMAVALLMELLHFLASFSCTVLAVMLTGKILTTVCAIGVFGLYIPMIQLLWAGMREMFLGNLFVSSGVSRSTIFCYSSPWAFSLLHQEAVVSGKEGLTGMWPTLGTACQLLAIAAVLTAVSVLLYRIRKTEAAGSALAFRKTEGVIKLMLAIPSSLIAAIVAHEVLDSVLWEILFVLIFGALGCMIMELIYRWDIRQAFARKRHIIVTFAAAVLIFCAFRYDVLGKNTWLPDLGEVESMAVKDNYLYFSYQLGDPQEQVWSNSVTEEVLDYLETEDFGPIYAIAQNGVENTGREEYEDVMFTYVKFHLKNGRDVYRCYWVDSELYVQCMDQLLENQEYREKYYPIFGWEGTNSCSWAEAYVPESWLYPEITEKTEYEDGSVYIEIPSDRMEEVIEAYRKDLLTVPYSQFIWANGNLTFGYRNRAQDNYEFSADFENTLEVLKEIKEG